MDMVTGAQIAVTVTVQVPRGRMWDLVTAVDRVGEWSPEVTGAGWYNEGEGPAPGARFIARNRFPNGFVSTVTCVVIDAERPERFAWTVLDGDGLVGSTWRYELSDGPEPGSTLVHHSFTHGPGNTGTRVDAEGDPHAVSARLVTLCRNMTTTIEAMATAGTTIGAVS